MAMESVFEEVGGALTGQLAAKPARRLQSHGFASR
jgi:hypothetical protein